jgi:hypothetical protein
MRFPIILFLLILLSLPIYAAVTATGNDTYSITMEQSSVKDAMLNLMNVAKKDYILDPSSPGPDFAGQQGTVATMHITNAKFVDALQILIDNGSWTADEGQDGRYLISWGGEAVAPSRVHVAQAADGKSFSITIDPKTSQETAIREIGQKIKAQVFIDPTASQLMKERGDSIPTLEGAFTVSDAEQAVRLVATPTFSVQTQGGTIIVSAPSISGHCSCGQALDISSKFCPACGKPVSSDGTK